MNQRATAVLWAIMLAASKSAFSVSPWLAESSGAALKLTGLDANFTANMSGAYWNGANRTFWVCCNSPGLFWALRQDPAGNWQIATNAAGVKARWAAGGDLEAICQANDSSSSVFLLDEDGWIRQYNVANFGVVNQTRAWDIRAYCPEINNNGPEGLTFVPDDWLRRECYRDGSGALRTSSNGMGGLMFVGSQIGGSVHVFDLHTNASTFTYCGSNQTARAETAELNSALNGGVRRLRTLIEHVGPRAGNLEGFALVSTPETNDWCLLSDDSNANGEGVALYRQFRPLEDADQDGLPDDWELRYFGSNAASDGMSDCDELRAGTNPTNAFSQVAIRSLAMGDTGVFIGWQSQRSGVLACTGRSPSDA